METVRLFDQDAYLGEFTAKVTECISEKGVFKVALDQTAFYPEGGGQPADTGLLNDVKVLDVHEKGGEIWHTVEAPIEPGTEVKGAIDWEQRYYYMQNHSGEHIVSGIVNRRFGYNNVGFHMNTSLVTLDFDGVLTEEQIKEIEREANRAVAEDAPISASYPSAEELQTIEYRSKKAIEGQVRLVTAEGYDVCACCGSHVKSAGEIRMIKILTVQKYKSGVRLSMLSGEAACRDYIHKHDEILKAARKMSVKPEQVSEAVEKLQEDNAKLRQEIISWKRKVYELQVQQLPENPERICFADDKLAGGDLKELANAALARAKTVLVIGGRGVYVLRSDAEDVREYNRELQEKFGGKGGGNAEMVQGTLQGDPAEIKRYFEGR